MTDIIKRSVARPMTTLFLTASLLSLTTPAAAFNGSGEGETRPRYATKAASEHKSSSTVEAETTGPIISYALYTHSVKIQPEPAKASVTTPEINFNRLVKAKLNSTRVFPSAPMPRASTAPMTAGEKFMLWVNKSFRPPGPYLGSVLSGMWGEFRDNDDNKKDTVENFFADSMTRAARSYAFKVTQGFFEKFAYPTIFRQDPRYHRSGKSGAGGKIGYAISRVIITQGDRSGDQFNISFLGGGLTAAFISKTWEREERRTTSKVLKRWGRHISMTALSNILREFLGGQ